MEQAVRRQRRWSDNDHQVGPFTFTYRETWRPFAMILSSGSAEHESPGCCIRLQAFGATLICELPQIIKPWRKWVKFSHPPKDGGYWDEYPREYGWSLNDGHLHICLGAQTHDSITTQDWSCFLPWTEWRVVANRIYNADGSLVGDVAGLKWNDRRRTEDTATRAHFDMIDHDGERITVATHASETEWRLGTGWFKWLGYLVPKKRYRGLDLAFSSETGPEKGSWKGGTVGTSIDMLPGETYEQAFRRYCDKDHRSKYRNYRVTFAGVSAINP